MEHSLDPKHIVADGYDQMGYEFDAWNSERPPEVRRWFLGEVLARLGEGSTVLELGCGPGTDAGELSSGRRYVGVDLPRVQLSIARQRVPHAAFVVGDFTSMAFRPASLDGTGPGCTRGGSWGRVAAEGGTPRISCHSGRR